MMKWAYWRIRHLSSVSSKDRTRFTMRQNNSQRLPGIDRSDIENRCSDANTSSLGVSLPLIGNNSSNSSWWGATVRHEANTRTQWPIRFIDNVDIQFVDEVGGSHLLLLHSTKETNLNTTLLVLEVAWRRSLVSWMSWVGRKDADSLDVFWSEVLFGTVN